MSACTTPTIVTGTPRLHHGTRQIPRRPMIRHARKRSGIRTGLVHSQKGVDQRRTDVQAPPTGQVLCTSGDWSVTSVGLADDRGFVICAEDLIGLTDTGLLAWPMVQAQFVPDWSAFWEAFRRALKIHHRMPRDRFDQALLERTHAAAVKLMPTQATA
jgi:hypothetical protein